MELREFKLHKDILWSIIQSQAGSLEKALLELVMNSVDAGAKAVYITLTAEAFKVVDDGKGFTQSKEIEVFFETFGTPHEKGDATYGRFRMGRGQIMAYTQNNWRSGPFAMEVNIRDKGLNYVLTTLPESVQGCSIEGTLYEPLKPSELLACCRALESLCLYTPIPVYLNEARISKDLAQAKWTFVDDDAYYLLRENDRDLQVYNLGVEVCKYPASSYGIGGLVVSRQQLEVNFARNDVLLSKCEVFKRIAAKVREYGRQGQEKKPVKNENYRSLLATRLLSGDVEHLPALDALFREEKLVTDLVGKHYSLYELSYSADRTHNGVIVVAPWSESLKVDKLHQSGLALVVSTKTLARFGVSSFEEILNRIEKVFQTLSAGGYSTWLVNAIPSGLARLRERLSPLEDVVGLIKETHHVVPEKDLTADEKEVLGALREAQHYLVHAFNHAGRNRTERALRAGESETAKAWTNGRDVIFINREMLKIPGYKGACLGQFTQLLTLLAHEYAHTEDDSTGHTHDGEFYEAYERATCATHLFATALNTALSSWLSTRQRSSKRLRSGDVMELDRQAALDAAV